MQSRRTVFALGLFLSMTLGCGSGTAVDGGGSDGGTDGGSIGLDGGTDAGSADGGTDAGSADGGTHDAGAGLDADLDAGSPSFTIEGAMVTGGCMPIVPADSAGVSWNTVITSPVAGTATATGTLTLYAAGGSTSMQSFSVTPTPMTFAAGVTTIPSTKLLGDPPIDLCADYCSGGMATLEVRLSDPASGLSLSQTVAHVAIDCVF